MLKSAIVRLLLFGVPFMFGYIATRPAPPAPKPSFVICAYADGQMKVVPNAEACTAGSAILVPAVRTLPGPDVQDEAADKTVHLPF